MNPPHPLLLPYSTPNPESLESYGFSGPVCGSPVVPGVLGPPPPHHPKPSWVLLRPSFWREASLHVNLVRNGLKISCFTSRPLGKKSSGERDRLIGGNNAKTHGFVYLGSSSLTISTTCNNCPYNQSKHMLKLLKIHVYIEGNLKTPVIVSWDLLGEKIPPEPFYSSGRWSGSPARPPITEGKSKQGSNASPGADFGTDPQIPRVEFIYTDIYIYIFICI